MSHDECADCGLCAIDLPDGVDPQFWFQRDEDGTARCQGCLAIAAADSRWLAGDW